MHIIKITLSFFLLIIGSLLHLKLTRLWSQILRNLDRHVFWVFVFLFFQLWFFYYISYRKHRLFDFDNFNKWSIVKKEKTISFLWHCGLEWEDPLDLQSGSRNQSHRQWEATIEISNTDETLLDIICMFDTQETLQFFRGKKSAVLRGIHPSYTRHEICSSILLVILHLVTPTILF